MDYHVFESAEHEYSIGFLIEPHLHPPPSHRSLVNHTCFIYTRMFSSLISYEYQRAFSFLDHLCPHWRKTVEKYRITVSVFFCIRMFFTSAIKFLSRFAVWVLKKEKRRKKVDFTRFYNIMYTRLRYCTCTFIYTTRNNSQF